MKMVVVPQADIDKLEEARIELCNLTDKFPMITQKVLFDITPAMHEITHRKYPENNTGDGCPLYVDYKKSCTALKERNAELDNDGVSSDDYDQQQSGERRVAE